MRILFVNPFYKPYLGGIERVIETLGREFLSDSRVERVGILTTRWAFPRQFISGLVDEEEIDGLEVFRLKSWPQKAVPFFQVPLVWFSPLEFRRVVSEFKPDVIQLMTDKWFWGNFWAYFWSRRAGIRVSFSLSYHLLLGQRSRFLLSHLKQLFLRWVNSFLTRRVDFIQVITNYEKSLVRQAYRVSEDKLMVIPWGIPHPSGVVSRHRGISSRINILAVGRLSKHKGQEWLLGVFSNLQGIVRKPVQLILAGRGEGKEILNLKSKISNLELAGIVDIVGEVTQEKLNQLYQEADIFALFPEYEAFGLVFLEALSFGVPVVSHKVGALPEVLQEGALLIEPYHQTQAQVVLTKLIEDDQFRYNLGQEGRKYVQRNFSWAKTADRFLQIYHSLLSS